MYSKLYKKIIPALLVVSVLLFNQGVSALSLEQKTLFNLGVYQFDVEVGSQSSGSCGTATLNLTGDSPAAKAMNFFQGQGLSDYQAAGIVGNLVGESSLMPNRKQGTGIQTFSSFSEVNPSGGYGIAQWTTESRQIAWGKFAEEKNMDPMSLELQLLYLWHELQTDPNYGFEHIADATDLRQATWIFLAFFERPAAVIDAGKTADPVQPTSGGAKEALDTRVTAATEATGIQDTGGGGSPTGGAATPATTTPASCDNSASAGGGAKYSADGYTFPLQISREGILNNNPAWCSGSTSNCHHDYNAADIFAPTGTAVLATRGGRVATAKDVSAYPSSIGSRVAIMGDDGWLYYYAHMGANTLKVRAGQPIEAGAQIGSVGTRENAAGTDPHLHIDRLPGKDYTSRPDCVGAGGGCNPYPFDNIQELMSNIFKVVK